MCRRTWVQILASVFFLLFSLHSFFLCYPGEALEGPISTGVSKKLSNVDSNNSIQISKKYNAKETVDIQLDIQQLWTFIQKILLTKKNLDQNSTRRKESGRVN